MEIEVPVLIGIGLAVMFFGYFFGLFEGRGQGYKKRKKEETQDQVPASVPPQRSPAAVTAAPPGQNLLELARDDAGRPYLRLDGEQVDASNVASGRGGGMYVGSSTLMLSGNNIVDNIGY